MSERDPALEVRGLEKRYGDRLAVAGVAFAIARGEIFGLLGPNGAGKTTTIGIVAGLVRPTAGRVFVEGIDALARPEAVRSRIGLVPQSIAVYPSLTAEENLLFFGRIYGLGGAALRRRVDELLELAGLEARRGEAVASFSGGMLRRLNLVCGLVHRPSLLLLDEPTVGVDAQSRERIFAAVEGLAAAGVAVLYTTHYMEEAERLCHRVAIQDEGRLVAEGTVDELTARLGGRTILVRFTREPSAAMRAWLDAAGARPAGPRGYRLAADGGRERIAGLLRLAAEEDDALAELVLRRPNLGEVFFALTGKALRDGTPAAD